MMTSATAGQVVESGRQQITIQPSCVQDTGNWVCLTCEIMFFNGIQMESHHAAIPGDHLIGWNCHHHGLEAP